MKIEVAGYERARQDYENTARQQEKSRLSQEAVIVDHEKARVA